MAVAALGLCAACASVDPAVEADAEPVSVPVSALPPDVSSVMGQGWGPFLLPGKRSTTYSVSSVEGVSAVRADARRSASMLRRQVSVAPQALGHIQFSWWVPALMAQARLREPAREDSPVRVVLAFDGDHDSLSMRNQLLFQLAHTLTGEAPPYATLMYVWDTDAALEDVIPAARTDRIRKIVVDSGPRGLQSWRLHERDIAADFRHAFGEEPGQLIGVGLMSDSDNTASDIHAFYGPVRLSGQAGRP
jgi:hypothetical protein